MPQPRHAVLMAGALALGALVATVPPLRAQAGDPKGKCATPALLQAQPPRRAPVDPMAVAEGTGPRSGAGVPVPMALGVPVEAPVPAAPVAPVATGTTAGAPPLPGAPPTKTQPTPPVPTAQGPPPSVPGLSPPSGKDKERRGPQARGRPIQAKGEVPEGRLIDVGIELFGPGVEEGDRAKLARSGFRPSCGAPRPASSPSTSRRPWRAPATGARYGWCPDPERVSTLIVSAARIVESNGKRLVLDVEAARRAGDRLARQAVPGRGRPQRLPGRRGDRRKRSRTSTTGSPTTSWRPATIAMRGARSPVRTASRGCVSPPQLAPEAFAPYLKCNGSGHFTLKRLPAEGDPMMRRIAASGNATRCSSTP